MNKVYRTVFNEKTNTWVAVSEVAKAHGKSGVSGNVVSTVLDGVLFDKKMLAVSTAVAAALASQTAMAANARIENGSAPSTIAISPSGSVVAGSGSAKATGEGSIATGMDAKADGKNSIALGSEASTETNSATYYRIKNVSDKTENNIAIGTKARSGGLQTIAFGAESVASKSQSIAFGFDAQATGDQSVALGANTRSAGDSSVAIGGDDLDSVASTVYRITSASADNDAYNDTPLAQKYRELTGQNLVNFTPNNRYIGTSTGQAGVAVGVSAKAADLATALGTKSHATGDYSVAVGVGANTDLANAVALGAGSTTKTNATDITSATIGSITYGGSTSPFAGSGKVGAGDQVSVGAAGFERQIKHVAPGAITAASTDAINGSQLFYVAKGLQEQITAAGGNGIHFYHVNGANTDNNYNNDGATGNKALAAGINAKAAGASSVAVGSAKVAEKSVVGQSNSEGAVAIGNSAYAAGREAVTLGASRAEEEQSVAIGSNARSSGKASMAIGASAVASQENSISIGSSANAAGNNSVSIGADSSTVVAAAGSVALGHTSQATRAAIDATKVQANAAPTVANNQVYALASASNTDRNNIEATVRGELGAVSVGTQNATRQIINVAAGTADSDAVNVAQLKAVANQITASSSSSATHYYSVKGSGSTDGNYNNDGASGDKALAAGVNASAKTDNSIAIGTNASVDVGTATADSGTVTGVGSVAVGADSAAKGTNAAAFGQKSEAFGQNSLAAGQDSHATGKSSVALGDGARGSKDSATAVGVYTKATGAGATAIGSSAEAETWGATALGLGAKAITNSSTTAIGRAANATGASATAVGAAAAATGNNSVAVGNDSKAAGASAFAAGHGAEAGAANSVSVGLNAGKGASNNTRTVAIGDSAAINSNGNNNVAMGTQAMNGYVGNASIGIGEQAGLESKGQHNTVIGWTAARHLDGDDNIAIGTRANDATAASPRTVANTVALGSDTKATVNGSVALGSKSVASTAAGVVGADPLNAVTAKNNATWTSTEAAVSVGDVANNITRQITGVAAGKEDTDVVNVAQLKAVASQITTQAVATTPLTVANGKVTPPATADQGKLATAGDIANAINNSGFQATAGGRLASGTTATATTVKPGQKVTFAAGNGLTVKQEVNATNGDQTYTYALDAQTVVQNAQTPVVYTDANGNKVYKHTDGNFYTQPNGGGTQVAAGNVIASMQDASGNTTAPTTLANVKGNLADTSNATGNPSGNDRATLAAGNKGNNAATVNDVLNAGFTVQGNGADKDFVTHGDTINFANGQGTVANVSTAGGVTTVKFDTPMTYADAAGNPTNTPSNKVNLVGGTAGSPVTLGNVADGNIAAGSKEAINGGQLHDLKENGFKISDGTTTDTVKLTETVTYKGDSNIVTTVTDNQVGFKLADSITVGPATGGNPVKIDGNAGTVTGLTNKTWNPAAITSGRAATEDQLKAAVATTPLTVANGKVTPPAAADANKLATASDIANAINNSGFNINAGGNVVGTSTATTAKPGSTLTLKAGDGLTVKQELDGNGNQSYTYALDSQSVVQNAQTPVVYTKADGTKVYKHPDGKFYDAPTGGNEVAAGDVIASMQDASGNTTAPTTLANVKGNLADTSNATGNPSGNDRATLAAGNKGNNAATVNDVLNAGFTVQGNGADKDFVTHGDTINFANGQGTVANVSTAGGVTTVKFDTPMTYADAAGNPTNTPSNKVNLVGGTAGSPVTLGNVAPGTLSATSTEAVNGSQLYATNQNVAKGINFGGTTGSNNYQLGDTINVKGDSNITSTTVNGGVQLGLNPNLNVTSVTATDAAGNQTVTNGSGVTITPAAGGGNPVSLTTGGLNNGGNKITNVAPGDISATSTDAVNGSQLHNAINNSVGNVAGAVENLQNRMGKLQDDSEAGTASALAAAGLPQAYLPGKSMIAVSGSTYRGQQGYAVGMSAISDSGNWIVKGTATGNSRGHFGATIGAGYQW
ncbi:YadA-like family protein [Kingella denitrificans]|uniref:YadA-like family protein n=1 Tax=Kingella denitrificans TaxID=502 RepID=UPI000B98EEB9|nr:YadA-like family protein [Kingella denitrificans]